LRTGLISPAHHTAHTPRVAAWLVGIFKHILALRWNWFLRSLTRTRTHTPHCAHAYHLPLFCCCLYSIFTLPRLSTYAAFRAVPHCGDCMPCRTRKAYARAHALLCTTLRFASTRTALTPAGTTTWRRVFSLRRNDAFPTRRIYTRRRFAAHAAPATRAAHRNATVLHAALPLPHVVLHHPPAAHAPAPPHMTLRIPYRAERTVTTALRAHAHGLPSP